MNIEQRGDNNSVAFEIGNFREHIRQTDGPSEL